MSDHLLPQPPPDFVFTWPDLDFPSIHLPLPKAAILPYSTTIMVKWLQGNINLGRFEKTRV